MTEHQQGEPQVAISSGKIRRTVVPFEFTGSGGEYFKIWIVNIALTVLTLGIYSAWAKVRNKRYFYGNTLLYGTGFDYLADPIKILKGRLIVFAIFLLYIASDIVLPGIGALIFMLLFLAILPWIIVRASIFNNRNSAYRNIRFGFRGTTKEAYKALVWPALLVPLTLGLAFPWFEWRLTKFRIDHSAFGTSGFDMKSPSSAVFYKAYLKAMGILLLFGVMVGATILIPMMAEGGASSMLQVLSVFLGPLFFIAYMYAYALLRANIFNHVLSNLWLRRQHKLDSQLKVGKLCWIYISNTVAIIVSFGLLIPWTKVRLTRYRLQVLTLLVAGSLDEIVAAELQEQSALGEEAGDFMDIDLGF